jgi:hypothetical protein
LELRRVRGHMDAKAMNHSGIPKGWKLRADQDGHLQFVRESKDVPKQLDPYADALLWTLSIVGTVLFVAIFAALVLYCHGIPPSEIPALLGIPTWSTK